MSVYLEQIKQLVELQKVDDVIFSVKSELEDAPEELRKLEERFNEVEASRNRIIEKLEVLQSQQKRLAAEIDDDSARLKKSKNKLMQVENTREYSAMMREMDSMEKSNRSREEEKVRLLEELQAGNERLEEIDRSYTELKAELEVKSDGLQEKLNECEAKLETLEKQRKDAAAYVPLPVFQRYEFIRSRLDHPVIVSVKEGVCTGCNIAIPPQSYVELQRGQQILSCPNCQRLIYWSEFFHDESENVASQKKQQFFIND